MKRILSVIVTVSIIIIIILLLFVKNNNKETKESIKWISPTMSSKIIYDNDIYEIVEDTIDPIENALKEMQSELDEIETIGDNMEWFIAYKEIVNKYEGILDPPKTVYDYFSEEEIYLIQRAVETETFDQDFMSKVNVASVIFNRIRNGNFGKNVEEVITTKNQFAYGRKNITESTILAVEFSFMICDTTNGCIGFRSDKKPQIWNGWEYSHTDDIGHHFYREKEGE